MKRRGFLGLMGGAAASAPTLAKGLAADVASGSAIGNSIGGAPSSAGMDAAYRKLRIAEIRGLLSKGEDVRQRRIKRAYGMEMIERFRLDGLKSVSAAHKATMLLDGNLDRNERGRRLYLEDELDRLLNPF